MLLLGAGFGTFPLPARGPAAPQDPPRCATARSRVGKAFLRRRRTIAPSFPLNKRPRRRVSSHRNHRNPITKPNLSPNLQESFCLRRQIPFSAEGRGCWSSSAAFASAAPGPLCPLRLSLITWLRPFCTISYIMTHRGSNITSRDSPY